MLKPTPLLACIGIIAFAGFVNGLKLEGQSEASQAAKLRAEISQLKDEIDVLQAEWYRLNHPERLQKLADENLALGPAKPAQIISLKNKDLSSVMAGFELFSGTTASIKSAKNSSEPVKLPRPRRAPVSFEQLINPGE